jgi:DNA (cytosine-5)-methyltransferase 1
LTAAPALTKPPFRIPSMADVAAVRGKAGLTVVSTFSGCGGSCLGFEMAGYRVLWANEFVKAARDTYALNHPGVPLDGRDIREVKPAEILAATELTTGELDVLQGSPPCASFSTAGKRERHWGKSKRYSDTEQRTDDLFFEFVRVLTGLQPRAFVAENVAGLTIGSAIGYFKQIMRALDGAGYHVRCKILDAQWLGVPQSRRRAIFIGTRKDLEWEPEYPTPLPYHYTLREVLPHLARAVHDTSGTWGTGDFTEKPCPAVTVGVNSVNANHYRVTERGPEYLSEGGVAVLGAWEKLRPGEQSKKYLNLQRAEMDSPSPCILAANGKSTSIACTTVPHEPRRFTIDELRVVCSFPADFQLTGSYAQQWERLGRAVPPLMMRAVARVLRDGMFRKLGRTKRGFREPA